MSTSVNEEPLESPSKKSAGLALNFAKMSDRDDENGENGIQEQEALIIFELPDGSMGESYFKLGQTVEVLKQFVETEYGIPMGDQMLWLDNHDQMMIDPLSLLDYPEAKGAEEIYIRVEGNLPADSKK